MMYSYGVPERIFAEHAAVTEEAYRIVAYDASSTPLAGIPETAASPSASAEQRLRKLEQVLHK